MNLSGEGLVRFNVSIVGSFAVGKSAILANYAKQSIDGSAKRSIGVDFIEVKYRSADGLACRVKVWDMASQSHFHNLTA